MTVLEIVSVFIAILGIFIAISQWREARRQTAITLRSLSSDTLEKLGEHNLMDHIVLESERHGAYKIKKGYVSDYFVTNGTQMIAELQNPYILLIEKFPTSISILSPILDRIKESESKSLLILTCGHMVDEVSSQIIVSKLRGEMRVAIVQNFGSGIYYKNIMEDIAIITGAHFIDSTLGIDLRGIDLPMLGRADFVEISRESTVIISGAGSEEDIKARISQIERAIRDCRENGMRKLLRKRVQAIVVACRAHA